MNALKGALRPRSKPIGVCINCGEKADGQWLRCFTCRQDELAARQGFTGEPTPKPSPYAGERSCSQQMSENCTKTFMSPDRRAVHCCPPCRHMQLLASYEWAGE
jgi:hypothetical protein